ncbi:MAG: SUMF1/EgtB/PvdO family nonheme iron enzyme [Chloroflexaceae bacterium]|nr:SUMF1/EgtB/PvdO family nonheme iron enzyme [Chloroflexaceae bacterium]
MSTERESLEKQRTDLHESLGLIDERIAHYVSPTDVPLQLLRDQKSLKQQLAAIEQRLQATPAAAAHVPPATTTTQTITNTATSHGAQGVFNAPVTFNIGSPAPEPPAPAPPASPAPARPDVGASLAELLAEAEAERARHEAQYRQTLQEAEGYIQQGGRTGPLARLGAARLDQLEQRLRAGLVAILNDPEQLLPTPQRVRAGFLLGRLGDPRYPVTPAQWQAELARRNEHFGQPAGYFCYVRGETYTIGTVAGDAPDNQKPAHRVTVQPFWIARSTITNQQWQAWVQQGGKPSYLTDASDVNGPNQPVVRVTWYMGRDFCAWLTQQLAAHLPPDYIIRLPTEAEWEIAAAYDAAMHRRHYPWGDRWADDYAATAENRESKGTRWAAPVGCFACGAAACGALDMAGNVWEWSASPYTDNYAQPASHTAPNDANSFTLRGSSFSENSTHALCGARGWSFPDYIDDYNNDDGVRVVCALRLGG